MWQPIRIGQMELKNRIVMPAMGTAYGSEERYVTDLYKNYLEARARGGTALIIVEVTYVHPRGRIFLHQLGISDDKFVPGMSELINVVHGYGAKIALQLHHGGRLAKSELTKTPRSSFSIAFLGGGIGRLDVKFRG
jgi:2,4-dienoyl-CoA reductase-like NADH-dependent reductase (Old Yellow Enzyme family)